MLTKSDYLKHYQCPKYVWLHKNRKDLLPPGIDEALQKRFDEGFEVEEQAYRLFPGGVSAGTGSFRETIARTAELVGRRTPVIFQPTFAAGDLFCRADILVYDGRHRAWDVFEVKSSTEVKEINLVDLAFQEICLTRAGLKVGQPHIIHVNNEYVRQGAIEPAKLLKIEEVTKEVRALNRQVAEGIEAALAVLRRREEPQVRILSQCEDPYECPFIEYCWRDIPERDSIYDAGLSDDRLNVLLDRGVMDVRDVPDEFITRRIKQLYVETVRTGQVHLEKENIRAALAGLQYPLHFLDYETYSPAIPMFDGYRPYQRIPFQYSLHVQRSPRAEPEHHEFLAESAGDPAPELAESLTRLIGPKGSVIAWNSPFEEGCNAEMGERLPRYADFFASVNARMFDPMQIVRQGFYADRGFVGSASLKKVLPVLVPGLSYEKLAIQEGETASESWSKLTGAGLSAAAKKKLSADMRAYCGRDTESLVRILEKFSETVG